jgi:hypothetical protein
VKVKSVIFVWENVILAVFIGFVLDDMHQMIVIEISEEYKQNFIDSQEKYYFIIFVKYIVMVNLVVIRENQSFMLNNQYQKQNIRFFQSKTYHDLIDISINNSVWMSMWHIHIPDDIL